MKSRKTIYVLLPLLALLLGSASVRFSNVASIYEYDLLHPGSLSAHFSIGLMEFIYRDFEYIYYLFPKEFGRYFSGGVVPLLLSGAFLLLVYLKVIINRKIIFHVAAFASLIYFLFWGGFCRNYVTLWGGWHFLLIMLGCNAVFMVLMYGSLIKSAKNIGEIIFDFLFISWLALLAFPNFSASTM